MISFFLAAALLPASAGAEEIKPSTPAVQAAQPDKQLPQKYSPALRQILRDLSILVERGGGIPAEKLDALAADMEKLDGKVKEVLGRDILEETARREEREDAAAAKKALSSFRASLQISYATNGGRYPSALTGLPSEELPALPELRLPGHAATSSVIVIDSKKYDKDFSKAVTDSGGWLYFSNPASVNYGLLVIDCNHREPGGEEFYKY